MQLKKLRKIAKNGGGSPNSSKDSSPTKPKAKITKAKDTAKNGNKKRKLKEIVNDDEKETTDLEDLEPMKVDFEPIKAEV